MTRAMRENSKRIVFLTGAFPRLRCGVGDYTYRLVQALSVHNPNIHVLTVQDSAVVTTEEIQDAFQVHSVIPSWSVSNLPVVTRYIEQIEPDIVHIQYPSTFGKANRTITANVLGIVARRASHKRVKILTTLHEFGERRLQWRLRALVNVFTSNAIICINRFDVPLITRLTFRKKPVVHIPLASAIPFVSITQDQRQNTRRSLRITDLDIVLAHFGFVTVFKGFEVLLEAIRRLKEEGFPVKLLIVTHLNRERNDYHCQMIDLIQDLDIQDVCLLGEKHYSEEEISTYLQAADLAVLPYPEGASDRRSSLLTVLQHRLPVITTMGPNVPPDFEDGKNMVLLPPDNPDAVVSAIEKLVRELNSMKHLADEAGKLARMFSWNEIAQQTAQLYARLLDD